MFKHCFELASNFALNDKLYDKHLSTHKQMENYVVECLRSIIAAGRDKIPAINLLRVLLSHSVSMDRLKDL